MKKDTATAEVFDLPKLKLEAALEVAAKALDYPAHRLNTPSRKPEAQLPVDALCLLHAKAQQSVKLEKALRLHLDFLASLPAGWLGKTTGDIGLLNEAYIASREAGFPAKPKRG